MSWLNISGNLSSLATNVTSFTREVLTEAKNDPYQHLSDDDDNNLPEDVEPQHEPQISNEMINKLAVLQEELNLANSELSSKNDEIYLLQAESNKIQQEHEKHVSNLQQHLLGKENEIQEVETRLREKESQYELDIQNLSTEKDQLELQLSKRDSTDADDGWGKDWESENIDEEELNKTKQENESLSNEVMMKEIILYSIEAKMCEISQTSVDVADFSSWIDHFTNKYVDKPDHDLENIRTENEELKSKIVAYENIISVIENNMSLHSSTGQAYDASMFQDWLNDFVSTRKDGNLEENKSREQMKQIEKEIREFDEEYENFEIANFHDWLEKVQSQIDDLEVELLNEQETKEKEAERRAVEREKLNELFKEKQNEIAALKVELYNITNSELSTQATEQTGINEAMYLEKLTGLQEQLNETNTRCEALQDEIRSLKGQNSNLHDQLENSNEEIETCEVEKYNYETKCDELQLKCSNLEKELSCVQEEKVTFEKNLNKGSNGSASQQNETKIIPNLELLGTMENPKEDMSKVNNQSDNNVDLENLCVDLKAIESILEAVVSNEEVDLERTWSCKSENSVVLLKLVQGVAGKVMELKEKCEEMCNDVEHYEEKCTLLSNDCKGCEEKCDSLKNDIETYKMELAELNNQINEYKEKYSTLINQNDESKEKCSILTNQVKEYEMKCTILSTEIDEFKEKCIVLQEKVKYEAESDSEKWNAMTKEIENCKEKFKLKEEELASTATISTTVTNLLLYISSGLDELQVDFNNDVFLLLKNGELQSTDISSYVPYMEVLKDSVQKIQDENGLLQEKLLQANQNNDMQQWCPPEQQEYEKSPPQIVYEEIQTAQNVKELNAEAPSKEGMFPVQTSELQQQLQDLQILHDMSNSTHESEVHELKLEISNLEGVIQELKTKASSTGGNMKFGALKRKMQELEASHELLTKENEQLKQGPQKTENVASNNQQQYDILSGQLAEKTSECQYYYEQYEQMKAKLIDVQNDMSSLQQECEQVKHILQEKQSYDGSYNQLQTFGYHENTSSQHQDQLHNLSLMLTEKSEECEHLQQQIEYMNSKLIEYQNDASDLELVREECKQLKTMLTGKEHQSRVDDTINLLQTEGKQLKQLLSERNTEYENLQKVLLEKENDLSDMALLQEECKQLKQMLMQGNSSQSKSVLEESFQQLQTTLEERDEELRQKNAKLIEMENSNSDMDLLREECKQLKVMLLNKGSDSVITAPHNTTNNEDLQTSLNSSTDEFQNSFMVQVQQLEEFLKEKEEKLAQKEQELQQKNQIILEMQHSTSDMDLLHNECRALKGIILEKEKTFSELQDDLDSANNMIQVKNEELKNRVRLCLDFEEKLQEANNTMTLKEEEYEMLKEELNENMAQDENIHILQTEYRNVEEQLKAKQTELKETQEKLFAAETYCERLKVYEEQYDGLKETLKEKDEQLSNLRLQSSEISILESETVGLLHQELNGLKTLVYERENQVNELTQTLEKKTFELQNIYNESKETITELRTKLSENYKHIEVLNEEKESLEELSNERHCRLEEALSKERELMQELGNMKVELDGYREKAVEYESFVHSDQTVLIHEKEDNIKHLHELLEQEKTKNGELEQTEIENLVLINDKESAIEDLKVELQLEQNKNNEHESAKNALLIDFKDKEAMIESLEHRLKKAHEKQEEILDSLQSKNHADTHCEKCKLLQNDKTEIVSIIQEIDESLQSDHKLSNDIVDNLRLFKSSIKSLKMRVDTAEVKCMQLEKEEEKLKTNLEQQLMQEADVEKVAEECEFKIQDLQSQLLELREMETLYQSMSMENQTLQDEIVKVREDGAMKCKTDETEIADLKQRCQEMASERNTLQDHISSLKEELQKASNESQLAQTEIKNIQNQLLHLQEENQRRVKEAESTASSVVVAECDRLREELEKNSHSYLEKNKECDQLKLDIFHLEENLHELRLAHEKLKGVDISSVELLRQESLDKQAQIDLLKSSLEDLQAKLESGRTEKQFLDQLVQVKGNLEVEKEELSFQKKQLANRVQELEVMLKHKDISYREIEAKASRELDRLRNHLMMTEENHTRDILEAQQREDALQKELDDLKQNLSKKAIILQDSSKQFQEHVVDLEEQLNVITAQRDNQELDLSKCKERMNSDALAIYNLQSALEQLEKDKTEQYEYLTSVSQRKQLEFEERIHQLTEERQQAQATMAEASLAVQGISKINLELQQKENELKVSKERMNELLAALKERDLQCNKMMEASDNKMDKSLIRNLLLKYFQAPEDKRSDIVQVIGGLLGLSHEEIQSIGTGAVPSKVGGWISNVWGYATPKKPPPTPKTPVAKYDSNKSFSELFVKFLEHESESNGATVDTASLTYNNDVVTPTVQMFSPATPDILTFHSNKNDISSGKRIPAPGQEIPRVHTHHAQSTLKTLLS